MSNLRVITTTRKVSTRLRGFTRGDKRSPGTIKGQGAKANMTGSFGIHAPNQRQVDKEEPQDPNLKNNI